jgi:glutamate--cysteine ligase
LRAQFRGAPLAAVAERVVSIAEGGLHRRARLNANGKDESIHLSRLRTLVGQGRAPADLLQAAAILERASLRWDD